MIKQIEQLHDLLLDNRNATLEELIPILENKISEFRPFNHDASLPFDACGLKRGKKAPNLNLEKVSSMVEVLEQNFSKRDIAFMFVALNRQINLVKGIANHIKRIED